MKCLLLLFAHFLFCIFEKVKGEPIKYQLLLLSYRHSIFFYLFLFVLSPSITKGQIYPYFQVDKKPIFKDGIETEGNELRLRTFFTENANTPNDSIQRAVTVRLLIDTMGHATAEFSTKDVFLEKEILRIVELLEFIPAEINGKKVSCYHNVYVDMTKENYYKHINRIKKQEREAAKNWLDKHPPISNNPKTNFNGLFFIFFSIFPLLTVIIVITIVMARIMQNKIKKKEFGLGAVCLKVLTAAVLSSLLSWLLIWNTSIFNAISGSGNFGGFLFVYCVIVAFILALIFIVSVFIYSIKK